MTVVRSFLLISVLALFFGAAGTASATHWVCEDGDCSTDSDKRDGERWSRLVEKVQDWKEVHSGDWDEGDWDKGDRDKGDRDWDDVDWEKVKEWKDDGGWGDDRPTSSSAVPEPTAALLFGAGVFVVGAATRRRNE